MSSRKNFGRIRGALEGLRLSSLARACGFQARKRGSLSPRLFFWSLVLGSLGEGLRTQAGLARLASRFLGAPVSRQALNQRFSEASAAFMRGAFRRLLRQAERLGWPALPGKLAEFEDIGLVDSSSVRLADKLARRFPACRTNVRAAAAKVHTFMGLRSRSPERVEFTEERVSDRKVPHVGVWVRNRLYLADLGYYDYRLAAKVLELGGDIVSRLKETANGTLLRCRTGCGKRYVGGKLNDARFRGSVVDVDVAFRLSKGGALELRVVGLRNRSTGDYHWYMTSLPAEEWTPEEIGQLYGLRWQIELLFKELKGLFSLGDLATTTDEHAVETLIYASLCALIFARMLCWYASEQHNVPWQHLSTRIAATIIPESRLTLGVSLVKGRYSTLKDTLDLLADTLSGQARVPNGTSAVLAFGEGAA